MMYSREHLQTHFCALAPDLVETGMQDYLNSLSDAYEKKFPKVQRLKEARGTDSMPKPLDAAKTVSIAISKVVEYETGSFLDVREL